MDENELEPNITKKLQYILLKYKSLFEGIKSIIYNCLPDGTIIDINSFGINLLGYSSKSDLINTQFERLYYNPKDRGYFNSQIKEKGYVQDFEVVLQKKNGEKFFGLETATIIKNDDNEIIEYIGIIKDINDRIKSSALLMKKNLELVEINKRLEETKLQIIQQEKLASIGQLAAGIAHEINNPLGFIKGNTNSIEDFILNITDYIKILENCFLLSKNEEFDQKSNETILNKIKNAKENLSIDYIVNDLTKLFNANNKGFERIDTIITGLKNFARTDNKRKIINYNLNSGFEDTLLILQNEIKYVATITKIFNNIPPVECNPNEINQVFLNIILNAAQALKEQKRAELGIISIETKKENNSVICKITDNGPGIPEENLKKIFDPFYTTKEIGVGTGLGLNISYDIIKKHNGDIEVISQVGKGSTFIITLPIVSEVLEIEM